MRANLGMISRHADDAAFLWSRWQRMLRSNHLSHAELLELEQRLEANLAALALAGEAGWIATLRQLDERGDPESTFVAVAVASDQSEFEHFRQVLSVAARTSACLSAVVSGIGRAALSTVEPWLVDLSGSAIAIERVIAIRGLGSHRRPLGSRDAPGLGDPEPGVRAAAARATGELGHLERIEGLRGLLRDRDRAVRVEAAVALARLDDEAPDVCDALLAASELPSPIAERAVASLVNLIPHKASSLFERWAHAPSSRHLAVVVAEEAGLTAFVEPLIAWTSDDVFARTAGDALRTIAGADMKLLGLTRPRPTHAPGDPTDDPGDSATDLPRDYELPFPAPDKVGYWWTRVKATFTSGRRYLDGKDVGSEAATRNEEQLRLLSLIARGGRPRLRTVAARAVARSRPREPSFETHAFSKSDRAPGRGAETTFRRR